MLSLGVLVVLFCFDKMHSRVGLVRRCLQLCDVALSLLSLALAGGYLNDEIMNHYMALCLKQHPASNVYVFSTFFWPLLTQVRQRVKAVLSLAPFE